MQFIPRRLRAPFWRCLVLTVAACAASSAVRAAIVDDSVTIHGNGTSGPYLLSGYFILVGSDTVRSADSILSRDRDYAIDYNAGRITFDHPVNDTDSLRVVFRRLTWRVPTRVQLKPDEHNGAGNVPVSAALASASDVQWADPPAARRADNPAVPGVSHIEWEGSKSFALSAGSSNNNGIRQGLELAVRGQLTPGLQLRAGLSDRTTSAIGRSGTSRRDTRLDDLEQIFVEAQSERFEGRWGELSLPSRNNGPGAGQRRASGLRASYTPDSHRIGGYIAQAHGRRSEHRLALRSGESGPYPLSSQVFTGPIISGSVVAWLDGRRLTEGPGADFVVDPERGTLSFSPLLAIRSTSIALVEYEQALDEYQRLLSAAAWDWEAGRNRHSLSVAWEAENGSRPLFGTLSDAERRMLAENPSGTVTSSAARNVGANDGDYRLDVSAGDSVFVYVGPENGDWTVQFERVGQGTGRYRHVIGEVFEYVGPGAGWYEPTATRSAPTGLLRLDESLSLSLKQWGAVAFDWRGDAFDPNRFASGNTQFRSDHRLAWTGGDTLGRFGVAAEWRHRADHADDAEYTAGEALRQSSVWRLDPMIGRAAGDEYSASTTIPVGKPLRLAGGGGLLEGRTVDGWRSFFNPQLTLGTAVTADYSVSERHLSVSNQQPSADWGRDQQAVLNLRPSVARIEAGWKQQDYRTGRQLMFPGADYSAAQWVSLARWGITATRHWDKTLDTVDASPHYGREWRLSMPLTVLGAAAGSDLSVARGSEQSGGEDATPYYRGRILGRWSVAGNADIQTDLELNRGRVGTQREVFIPTRRGAGEYRLERGEYIPDPNGDYRRLIVEEESQTRRAYESRRRWSANWRPRIGTVRLDLRALREINARYAPNQFRPEVWLLPWQEMSDAVLPGGFRSTLDHHVLTVYPDAASQIEWRLLRDLRTSAPGPSDIGPGSQSRRTTSQLGMRRQLDHAWYAAGRIELDNTRRFGSAGLTIDADATTFAASLGLRPSFSSGLSIEGRRRLDSDRHTKSATGLWGVIPEARLRFGPFSANAIADLTWVRTRSGDAPLSALLAQGRPYGFSVTHNWDVRCELPKRVTLKLKVYGDHRPRDADRWGMMVESIARF